MLLRVRTLLKIRKTDYPDNYFDAISCISTLEHIGVAGRYGSDDDPEGDAKTMHEIKRILKPGGILLTSLPYGAKDVVQFTFEVHHSGII